MAVDFIVVGAFLAGAGVFAATRHAEGALAVAIGILLSRTR